MSLDLNALSLSCDAGFIRFLCIYSYISPLMMLNLVDIRLSRYQILLTFFLNKINNEDTIHEESVLCKETWDLLLLVYQLFYKSLLLDYFIWLYFFSLFCWCCFTVKNHTVFISFYQITSNSPKSNSPNTWYYENWIRVHREDNMCHKIYTQRKWTNCNYCWLIKVAHQLNETWMCCAETTKFSK